MNLIVRGAVWFVVYLFLILFPLVVAAVADPIEVPRPFLVEVGVALGAVGLSIMAFQFALVSRTRAAAAAFGEDALLQFHRQIGLVALACVWLHPLLLVASDFAPLAWMIAPVGNIPWAAQSGTLSAYALTALIALSVWRARLRLAYEWWQATHALLAIAAVALGMVHMLAMGGYANNTGVRLVWAVYLILLGGLAVNYRLVRPLRMLRRPWEVARNVAERGGARTLVLRPVGHAGMAFQPGQFAWLITGRTPFALEQHPLSFSSSAETPPGGEVAFTIKAAGDWSSQTVPVLQPGRRVWVDGPYGVFSVDREEGPGYVLIAGGSGIAPLRSMLVTLAAREDVRPVLLFYGNRRWEDMTYREELDALAGRMNLKVVYTLEEPPPDWVGEVGYIDAATLQRHLPKQFKRFRYFVCGPGAMMDAMEHILTSIGVPRTHVFTERFDMV